MPQPLPPPPLPRSPRWPWVPPAQRPLYACATRDGGEVSSRAGPARAWEYDSRPGGIDECLAHAKRQSAGMTNRPPGGELDPGREGARQRGTPPMLILRIKYSSVCRGTSKSHNHHCNMPMHVLFNASSAQATALTQAGAQKA